MITCDRCRKEKNGWTGPVMSAGCYVVDKGGWEEHAREGEKIICDECMWNDPKYIAIYGKQYE